MCYAKRYAHILTSIGIPIDVLHLPPQTRLNVMKALTALSKYLGCYERWKATSKQYNLKWTTGSESIASLERFFNPNLTLRVDVIQGQGDDTGITVRHSGHYQVCRLDWIASDRKL